MGKGMPLTWSVVKSVRLIFSSRPDQEAPPKTRFMPLPRSRTFGRRRGEMVRGVGRIGMGHLFLGGMAAGVCGHYNKIIRIHYALGGESCQDGVRITAALRNNCYPQRGRRWRTYSSNCNAQRWRQGAHLSTA